METSAVSDIGRQGIRPLGGSMKLHPIQKKTG